MPGIPVITIQLPGSPGPAGPPNTLSIGSVTTGAAGSSASVTISGSAPNQVLDFVIPTGPQGLQGPQGVQGLQGPQGPPGTNGVDGGGIIIAGKVATYSALPTGLTSADAGKAYLVDADGKLYIWTGSSFPSNGNGQAFTGPAGPANTLTIGTVTTGAAGSSATATITGSAPNQVLNLTIPQGAAGATGAQGTAGPANTLAIGSVTTGAPGTAAVVTISGASPNQTLSFTIPRGDTGGAGPQGPPGANGTNGVDGQGVPVGGGPGQVLSKLSDSDYDTGWVDQTGSGTPTYETIPAGSMIVVQKGTSGWPSRPTSRTDVFVAWKGADPSPTIVSSGTGGMLDNVDFRLVTP